MKILWLASWYPSRVEPFNGDFVQRHAGAVSLYHGVEVLHVVKDASGFITKDLHVERRQEGRLKEQVVYYYHHFQKIPALGRLFSQWKYRRIFKKQIAEYLKENGRPDLVHVHVCMKAGPLALWLKRKYNLPYVLTEHATLFLPEAKENIYRKPFYYRNACAAVLKNANAISVVSDHLGKAIQAFVEGRSYKVIPNVVNTEIFYPVKKTGRSVFEFIHISSLGYQKNFDVILEAINILKNKHANFVLRVFGSGNALWRQRVTDAGLSSFVIFHNEVPQPQLAPYLQRADALILFSRYETFGCVLIEAAACGVPAIVNDIPPMREVVTKNVNGLVVQNNAFSLAEALTKLMEKKLLFDSESIARQAREKYSYENIGRAFSAFYEAMVRTEKSTS